ncbi:MAG: class I SAM-dependent methyltransferase [Gammaproteobacteria bacterium]|nr:class I SAM-dependent methyltransferase [Gammaproteobacteria bacterium]
MSSSPPRDSTQRFSDRVADYQRYRPGYPAAVFDYLIDRCRLTTADVVVDVGAGTGLSTEPWLTRSFRVQAVEPNAEMRAAAADCLTAYPQLELVDGTAEALPMPDGGAGLITAAQAFHWFESDASRSEFKRVLKPDGHVALIWNERQSDASAFLKGYEKAMQAYASDYSTITHERRSTRRIVEFFAPDEVTEQGFDNTQAFDFEALCGRVWSSSYAPPPDSPNYAPLREQMRQLFDRYASDGNVHFIYRTRVFTGRLS